MTPSRRDANERKRRLTRELRRQWTDPEFLEKVRNQAPFIDVAYAVIGLRAELGLTQAELAARSGTTQSVIARLESGRHGFRTTLLNDIARGVGLTWRPHFEVATLGDFLPAEGEFVDAAAGNVIHLDQARPDVRHEPALWSVTHRTARPEPESFSSDEVRELLERFVDTYLGAPTKQRTRGKHEVAEERDDYSSAV